MTRKDFFHRAVLSLISATPDCTTIERDALLDKAKFLTLEVGNKAPFDDDPDADEHVLYLDTY